MTRRIVVSRDKDEILRVYKALVKPLLEYCIQVLNLHLKKDVFGKDGSMGRSAKKGNQHDKRIIKVEL